MNGMIRNKVVFNQFKTLIIAEKRVVMEFERSDDDPVFRGVDTLISTFTQSFHEHPFQNMKRLSRLWTLIQEKDDG